MAKILIVDDSEPLVALLSAILSENGFEVESALSKKGTDLLFIILQPGFNFVGCET